MSDDFYRVLSEPTPKAERDAVIRAEWQRHRAAQRAKWRGRLLLVLIAALVLFGCAIWFWSGPWPGPNW